MQCCVDPAVQTDILVDSSKKIALRTRRNNPYLPVFSGSAVTPSNSSTMVCDESDRSSDISAYQNDSTQLFPCEMCQAAVCQCDMCSCSCSLHTPGASSEDGYNVHPSYSPGHGTYSNAAANPAELAAGNLFPMNPATDTADLMPMSTQCGIPNDADAHTCSSLSCECNHIVSQSTPEFLHESTPSKSETNIKVAVVSFKFGQNHFRAPFRVSPGDVVIVEWEATNRTTHVGVVSAVLNGPVPGAPIPTLNIVRRARPDDERKIELITLCDSATIAESQRVLDNLERAGRLSRHVFVVDAEWQLDKSSATVLINFSGTMDDMKAIHAAVTDRLTTQVYILTI